MRHKLFTVLALVNFIFAPLLLAQEITTTLGTGRQTVTTAGTRVQLTTTSTRADWVIVTAETDNTGVITAGGSGVVGALATRQGVSLQAGDSVTVITDNLTDIYLDTTVNGDGVTYVYGT